MIVADRLGIPFEQVRFVQSDTAVVPRGGGTGGSRSLQLGGTAVYTAARKRWSSGPARSPPRLLEADARRHRASPTTAGSASRACPRRRSPGPSWRWPRPGRRRRRAIWRRARLQRRTARRSRSARTSRSSRSTSTPGASKPIRHVAVDDCGRILNPLIVRGQQHGGIAQGVAQALWEQYVYDDDGNPLTATLTDYAMPSAAELPSFETSNTETPSPRNPLGAKGIGESGTIGSTPAVQNAVIDALSHLGVRHIDMPCTPERVWRAIRGRRRGRLAVAGAAGDLRAAAHPGRRPRTSGRRGRHLTSTSRPAAAAASPARWSGPAGAGPGRPRVRRWRRCSRTPHADANRRRRPAGLHFPARVQEQADVVEHVEGSTATDFGVPGTVAAADAEPLTRAGAIRLALLVAAYVAGPRRRRRRRARHPPQGASRRRARSATPSPPTCSRPRRPTPGSWACAGRPPPSAMRPPWRSTARRSARGPPPALRRLPSRREGLAAARRGAPRRVARSAGRRVGDRGQERARLGPRRPVRPAWPAHRDAAPLPSEASRSQPKRSGGWRRRAWSSVAVTRLESSSMPGTGMPWRAMPSSTRSVGPLDHLYPGQSLLLGRDEVPGRQLMVGTGEHSSAATS